MSGSSSGIGFALPGMNLSPSGCTWNLCVTTTNAGIAQSGSSPISVSGTSSFNAGTGAITLTNTSNVFTGAVTLQAVTVIFDADLKNQALQCHPLINSATLVIPFEDIKKFLSVTRHEYNFLDIPTR